MPEVNSNLQYAVNEAERWFNGNRLCINLPKSHTLMVSSTGVKSKGDLNITLNDHSLKQVETVKYLGVHIDSQLSWSPHISSLYKTVNSKLFVLRKLRAILPPEALKIIYKACIEPLLDYCDTVWDVCGLSGMRKAQSLQNMAARIITGIFNFIDVRGVDLVKRLGWQTLRERRHFHTAVLMYKCINGMAPDYLSDQVTLISEVNTYNTRSSSTLEVLVPTVNRSVFKKSFSYNGAIIWNSLPDFIRRADSLQSFKLLYKRFYFSS